MASLRATRRRSQRGAAAVEAALIGTLLTPFLLGVLGLGTRFWGLQDSHAYEPRLAQSDVVGVYTSCQDLLAVVRNTVLANVNNLPQNTPVALGDVTAEVVDFLPDQLGVDVRVSVRVAADTSLDWLPFVGDTVVESQVRLENVRLTVQSC